MRTLREVIQELAESTEMQVNEYQQLIKLLSTGFNGESPNQADWDRYIAYKGLVSLLDQPVK